LIENEIKLEFFCVRCLLLLEVYDDDLPFSGRSETFEINEYHRKFHAFQNEANKKSINAYAGRERFNKFQLIKINQIIINIVFSMVKRQRRRSNMKIVTADYEQGVSHC
jgi:hypothetical protein